MSRSSVQTHLSPPDLAAAHQLVLGVERFRCVCCVCACVCVIVGVHM